MTRGNELREGVLDRMARADRHMKLAIAGAVLVEALLLLVALLAFDWSSRVERVLFVFSILAYTILVLGLAAPGAHVSRGVARVLAALATLTESD